MSTFPIPFTHEPETRPNYPCRAFRWTFRIERWFIGFIHQHQWDGPGKYAGEWADSHTRVYGFSFNWPGRQFGSSHWYYDGPHCSFFVGPFQVQWHNDNCKKCHGEER